MIIAWFAFFTPLATVIGQVGFGPNLKCYQCNSLTQPRCADHFDNRTMILTPCPDDGKNYSRCMKAIQEMYIDGLWVRRYYRDCAVTGEIGLEDGRWCLDRSGVYRVKVRYCNCNNKNGCNLSNSVTVSSSLLLIMQLFLLALHDHQRTDPIP
ncbi:Cadmium metallothionein (MT-Cd) (Cd-MT) [Fasciolopsis buskii]|uniref:Cadmium metallothionein (MT-Cd) (Cd-MT) n=1 Tax=Fasciolopsis buskii TaxID=27845 RepID=A0A8E0VFK0_9TREM|nr:Cadmium metallothionein (MT-Cd) (Cd-MT) [Fasciolopsis buski]